MRAGDLLQLVLVAMAAIADSRRNRAEMVRSSAQRREIFFGMDVALAGRRWRLPPGPDRTLRPRSAKAAPQKEAVARKRRGGCPRRCGGRRSQRHVVMAAVAVDAGHLAVGVLRPSPAGSLGAIVLFVANRQASARATGSPVLKLKIRPGSRPWVSRWRLAGPWQPSHESLRCTFSANDLAYVAWQVAHKSSSLTYSAPGHPRQRALDLLIANLGEERVASRPARIDIGFGAGCQIMGRAAGSRHQQQAHN